MYQFLFGIILCSLLANINADITTLQCYLHNKSIPFGQTVYFENIHCIYIFPSSTSLKTCNPSLNGTCKYIYKYEIYKWNMSRSSSWFEKVNVTAPAERWAFWSPANNVVAVNDRAYFIGMTDVISNFVQHEVYVFYPANDSFMVADSTMRSPISTDENCLTTNGSHIFLIGSHGSIRKGHPRVQMYDVSNNTWYYEWIYVPSLQYAGYSGQACVMIKDEIFLFGGELGDEPEWTVFTDQLALRQYYKYRWPGNWTFLGNKSEATRYSGIAYKEDLIFIVGGETCDKKMGCSWWPERNQSAAIDIFNISSERIINTYYLDVGLKSPKVLTINNTLYIFGKNVFYTCETLVMPETTQTETSMPTSTETKSKVTEPNVTEPKGTESTESESTEAESKGTEPKGQTNMDVIIGVMIGVCIISIIAITAWVLYCRKERKHDYVKTNQADIDLVDVQVQNTIK